MNDLIENKTFDEIEIGDRASLTRTLDRHGVEALTNPTGSSDLITLNPGPKDRSLFGQGGNQAGWSATLFANLAGTRLPGLGSVTRRIETRLHLPMALDPPVTAIGIVKEKWPKTGIVLLACEAMDAAGKVVASGLIEVLAPKEKIRHEIENLPKTRQRYEEYPVGHPHGPDASGGRCAAATGRMGVLEPDIQS